MTVDDKSSSILLLVQVLRVLTSSSVARRSSWIFQQLLTCTASTAGLLVAGTQCANVAA